MYCDITDDSIGNFNPIPPETLYPKEKPKKDKSDGDKNSDKSSDDGGGGDDDDASGDKSNDKSSDKTSEKTPAKRLLTAKENTTPKKKIKR